MEILAKCERCERPREIIARGLCSSCYTSWKRWMNPTAAKKHAANYRDKHRDEIRQYQQDWNNRQQQIKDESEQLKDSLVAISKEVLPAIANKTTVKGKFTIAVETPTGNGWILGEFKFVPDVEI